MSDESVVAELSFSVLDDTPFTSTSPLAEGRSFDASFYEEVNRVVSNLKVIKLAQPGVGTLVSFAQNADGERFKIILA